MQAGTGGNAGGALRSWLWITLGVIVLDQLSKFGMSEWLSLCSAWDCPSVEILPVFKLTLFHNTGAAFSFLDDQGGWQRWFFACVASVVSCILFAWFWRLPRSQTWLALGLVLILGGAIGNLIDRILLGYVVDFLVVHYEGHYFPAFNVADSAITVGAGCMILDMLLAQPGGPGDEEAS